MLDQLESFLLCEYMFDASEFVVYFAALYVLQSKEQNHFTSLRDT